LYAHLTLYPAAEFSTGIPRSW